MHRSIQFLPALRNFLRLTIPWFQNYRKWLLHPGCRTISSSSSAREQAMGTGDKDMGKFVPAMVMGRGDKDGEDRADGEHWSVRPPLLRTRTPPICPLQPGSAGSAGASGTRAAATISPALAPTTRDRRRRHRRQRR